MKKDDLLESFINRGENVFFDLLKLFLESKGKKVEDYCDYRIRRCSIDDGIVLYKDFLNVPGAEDFIKSCNLMVSEIKYYDYLGKWVVGLRPINNDKKFNSEQKCIIDFNKKYRNSDLYHISKVKDRDSILRYGLKTSRSVIDDPEKPRHKKPENPKYKKFNKNFEAYDNRIYLIIYDLIQELGDDSIETLSDAIYNLAIGFVERDKKDTDKEFDVWEVTLPENVPLHDDPSFPYGGYIKNPIPPQNIHLINTYDAKSDTFDKGRTK